MATVKYTNKLDLDVTNIISKAFEPRVKSIQTKLNEVFTFENIVNAYIEATGGRELYEKCKDWLPQHNSVYINSINGVRTMGSSYLVASSTKHMPIPRIPSDINLPALSEYAQQLQDISKQYADLIRERSEFTDSVRKVLRAYPSVNAAVKAKPELEALLPNWAKQKMAEKITRSKPEDVDVSLDIGKVNQVAIINRLQGNA